MIAPLRFLTTTEHLRKNMPKKISFTRPELTALNSHFGQMDPMGTPLTLRSVQSKVKVALATKVKTPKPKKVKRLSSKAMKKLFKEIQPKTPVFNKNEFMEKVLANINATNAAAKSN